MTVHLRLNQVLPYVPMALVIPLLWVTSEGEVAVKPVALVAVAAAAAFSVWTAFAGYLSPWLDGVLVGLLGLAATHRLLWPGFPQGIDTDAHIWGLYGLYQAVLAGNVLPRWIHHVGLGRRILLFYPPLAFYLVLPFLALGLAVYDAFKFGLVLFSVLSSLSMFYLARQWTGAPPVSPPVPTALRPTTCWTPCTGPRWPRPPPWPSSRSFFYYAHRAIEAPSRKRLGIAAAWTEVLALTHPLSLSMVATTMGIWVLARHRWRADKALLLSFALLALIGLWGFGLAGNYTVPVIVESRYTSIDWKMPWTSYYFQGLTPKDLLKRRRWSARQIAEQRDSPNERNKMLFYFGLSLLSLLPLARHRRVPRGLLAMTLGAMVLGEECWSRTLVH